MTVYPRKKYIDEKNQLTKRIWALSFADIRGLQDRAHQIFNARPPPGVQQVNLPAPAEDDVLVIILKAIEDLKQSPVEFKKPDVKDVPAEWVQASDSYPSGQNDDPTLLYVHGGGFLHGSPGTARRETIKLSKLTKGRCLAIKLRCCTDEPFPAQLLDLLVSYLSLLAPAKTSNYESARPNKIVLVGESSGFNLVMACVQVLLYAMEKHPVLRFHGKDVKLQLPAGVAGVSGFFDITCGLPSWTKNAQWDCLPEIQPTYLQDWRDQKAWPAEPPRADVYCEKSAMTHPLANPVTALNWAGAPPMFLACGEERNADGTLYLAREAARQGVPVHLEQYEAMLHVWAMVLPKLPHSTTLLERWAAACCTMVEHPPTASRAVFLPFETLEPRPMDVINCTSLTRTELMRLVKAAQEARMILHRKDQVSRL